jgi:L-alanine-DL-glutamate epimerase-like enolase superfamily enzyme
VGGVGKQLLQYVERGHRAVKMRVGLQDRSVNDSAGPLCARRARLSVPTWRSWWTPTAPGRCATAQRFARKVADCDLAWLEEPVSPDNVAGQARCGTSTDIPIAAGESEQTRFAFRELIEARAVDVLQPDPAIAGGITETHGSARWPPPTD